MQAANVALGLDETAGLRRSAVPVTRRSPPQQRRRGHVLVEALPYIRRFAGQVVVVKYGGNALAGTSEHDALALFAEDIVLMRLVGMRPVVVHGGGPQISDLMSRLGKQTEFRNGLRVTDAETVDIARMVLIGQVNPQLVAAINVHGRLRRRRVRRGRRADPRRRRATPSSASSATSSAINPTILEGLIDDEFIPVVATIGTDATGQAYNINADTVAGAIAEALGAEKLVYLTDIEGLRRDVDDPASLIRQTTADELDALIADGTIAGGMIPKVESCVSAVRNGVRRAHILDGRIAHVLLLELFTDDGIGTMVASETEMTSTNTERRRIDDRSRRPSVRHPRARPLPVHAGVRRAAGDVRARPRHRAVGHRRQALPRLPVRARGHLARPRQPGRHRAIAQQADDAAARQQLLRQPGRDVGGDQVNDLLRETTGHDGQVFFCNSGAEANEARSSWPASSAAAAATWSSARSAASTAARWPRWPPPASRPSTSRSSRCPTASATSRSAISMRSRGRRPDASPRC